MQRVPDDRIGLRRGAFDRGRAIRSGQGSDTATEAAGLRGLTSELQFARAHRVQVLAEADHYDDDPWYGETTSSWADASESMTVRIGEGVTDLEVVADVEDGEIRLVVDGVQGPGSGSISGRAAHVATCPVVGGQAVIALLQIQGDGVDVTNLRSWRISELPLHTQSDLAAAGWQANTRWHLADVDTIEVLPLDSAMPAVIYARARGRRVVPIEVPSSGMTCDISSAGLGGLATGYSEASGTGYLVHATTDGTTPRLIAAPNLAAPLRILDVRRESGGSQYRALSPPVSFGSNTATATDASPADLVAYDQRGSRIRYLTSPANLRVISAHKGTSVTYADLRAHVPTAPFPRRVHLRVVPICQDGTARTLTVYDWTGSGVLAQFPSLATLAGSASDGTEERSLPLNADVALNACIGVAWGSTVTTGGVYLDVLGVEW